MCSPYRPKGSASYSVRKRVPEELRELAGKREFKKSLRTRDWKEAKLLAPAVCSEFENEIARLRRSLHLNTQDLNELAGEYFNQRLNKLIESGRKEQWGDHGFSIPPELLLDKIEPKVSGLTHDEYEAARRENAANRGFQMVRPVLDKHGLIPPPVTAQRLGLEVFHAEQAAYKRAEAEVFGGDWTPSPYANVKTTTRASLIELWQDCAESKRNDGTHPGTLASWKSYIRKASIHFNHKPAAEVSKQDVWSFVEALRSPDSTVSSSGKRLAAKTVNDNYLAALSALYKWAIDREVLDKDPSQGVRAKGSASETPQRDAYNREQVAAILKGTRQPQAHGKTTNEHAMVRRWLPWLLALTGARVAELLWLKCEDVSTTEGITYVTIRPDIDAGRSVKTSESTRSVPLHPAIINEGFSDYVAGLPASGYLFPGDWEDQYGNRTKTPANKLREWIKKQLPENTDWPALGPNHSFRHWLTSECRRASIDGDYQRVIIGHSAEDIHGRYGQADVPELYDALCKIPSPVSSS